MIGARTVLGLVLCGLLVGSGSIASGQEKRPATLWDELKLFSYVENSYTFNLTGAGRDATNEWRIYDFDEGYTFNMAEFSLKKDPSEKYPFGFGLVATGGQDAQKNHAIGIFRDENDAFPYRNTSKVDLQEAYVSGLVPMGSGLTLKAGKFVTLLGYEVIESPNNLNFSRSFLFGYAIPLTHVGALASYSPTDWLSVAAGPVIGWDIADDNNDTPSYTGQIAVTPIKDLSTSLNWIVGKEYSLGPRRILNGGVRWVLDVVANYTGIKNTTLGFNLDYGEEDDEAYLKHVLQTRSDFDARWWGWAAYGAYDWTEKLRTALRVEYFTDPMGARTQFSAFGQKISFWEATATAQYKIWKGLVGRLEYRHDSADEKAFKIRTPALAPTSKELDTISVSLFYSFF